MGPDSFTKILDPITEESQSMITSESGITSAIKSRDNRKIPGTDSSNFMNQYLECFYYIYNPKNIFLVFLQKFLF